MKTWKETLDLAILGVEQQTPSLLGSTDDQLIFPDDLKMVRDRLDELFEVAKEAAQVLTGLASTPMDPRLARFIATLNAMEEPLLAKRLHHHPPSEDQQELSFDGIADAGALWGMHLQGPDDWHAAPSREEAEGVAGAVNDHHANSEIKPSAVVGPWPHSAEAHSASLSDWHQNWVPVDWP